MLWIPALEKPHFSKDARGTLVFYPNGFWLDLIAKRVEGFVISSDGEYQRLRRLVRRISLFNIALLAGYLYLVQQPEFKDIKGLFIPFCLLQHFGRKSMLRRATKVLPRYPVKTSAETLLQGVRQGRRPRFGGVRLSVLIAMPVVFAWLLLVWMPRSNWHHGVARDYLILPLFGAVMTTTMLLIVFYERLLGAKRFQAWRAAQSMLCAHNVLIAASCCIWTMIFYVRFGGWP